MKLLTLPGKLLARFLMLLPSDSLEALVYHMVSERAGTLPARESARFLMRLDSRLYPLQGQAAVAYGNGVHTKHRHMRYHDFFIGRICPDERVLDIGCGIGALAYDVAEKAEAQVVGIDLNANNIAQAQLRFSHPRVCYIVGDVLKELPVERFEVVILSNVLEHINDRLAFLHYLREIVRVQRFLIRVPLFERDWRVPLKQELGVEWRLDLSHETEYTLESFAAEMAAAGLRIIHQEVRWGEIWAEAIADHARHTAEERITANH